MNFLLRNLAVADIMVALFIAPRLILEHYSLKISDGMTGTIICKLLTGLNFAWFGAAASIFTLVANAFERYYSVVYPYGNKGKLTFKKLKVSRTVKEKLKGELKWGREEKMHLFKVPRYSFWGPYLTFKLGS